MVPKEMYSPELWVIYILITIKKDTFVDESILRSVHPIKKIVLITFFFLLSGLIKLFF